MRLWQILDRRALIDGSGTGVVDEDRHLSWEQVRRDALAMAAGLAAQGIEAGDYVAILAMNGKHWLSAYFAIWRIGAIAVPLNMRLSVPEITEQLADCGTALLLCDETHEKIAKAAAAALALPVRRWDLPATTHQASADVQTIPDHGAGFEDVAGVFYTGGSTGRPKGVLLSHRALYLSAMGSLQTVAVSATHLHTAPLFHLSGVVSLIGGVMRGSAHVFLPKFDAGQALRLIERYRPSSLVLAPTMLQMLLDHPDFARTNLGSLRTLVYGSAPMPEPLLRRAMASIAGGIGFMQGYGMTEAAGAVTNLAEVDHDPDRRPELLRAAGRPVVFAEIEVRDSKGRQLAEGEVGEVWVRTPTIMTGYLNQPEETARVLVDGWFRSGDGGRIENGYLYIVDRLKDMIVTGGENVYCVEVESVIASHPAVAQVAVFGVPDDRWGELVHAEILLRESGAVDSDDILQHCRERIAGYKLPRSINLRDELLPVTAAGKIAKTLLREPFWTGRSRAVN